MKPVLAFDWCGTLVADIRRATQATAAVLRRHGREDWDTSSFRDTFRLPLTDFFAELAVPPTLIEETVELWHTEMGRSRPVPAPGAVQLLRQARNAGWAVAVVSAVGCLEQDLNHLGWHGLIDFVHPGVTDKAAALRELAETGPVTYVGDTEYDVVAATRACATAVAYTGGYRPADALLTAGPAATVDDLDALAALLAAPDCVRRRAPRLSVLHSVADRSSGYLLHTPGGLVLVDCGPGVVDALDRSGQLPDVRAVVITHAHAGHSLDVVALASARHQPRRRPLLFAPAHALDLFDQLDRLYCGAVGRTFEQIALPMDGTTGLAVVPGVTLFSYPARHSVPSAALRFQLPEATVAFSSDTGVTDAVIAAASDATVFVCEATHLDPVHDTAGHLSARQAGLMADRAGAETLLLSHLADPADGLAAIERARDCFDNSLTAASSGTVLSLVR
ncbi:ribonuclease BN (tRNA processing enzyme)/phosphoglycolate phosphatase-like HAD superfamily hydrolase [Amycolatopsis bartoniae]|uniref:Metallo-beta-lactamase domain-containing protein n=1 Tax=Amycolatopsis bartoniae TaxID=941986 RepID=A0A8H9IT47_9PSEU|nr:MBL fold metallo-hydrolase [Amycolatopsis bartoniae]MBB2933530.1 ribonuclease BN (tRNA processing enzyme)/phosphoglycolate phosphatase-like HAD superfamily hydrolase [Amycolatopsis bartoniae]TVT07627.1 MBL fold metallo-hydrolase [Amycolatopsis bartoniae]GHF60124.1 hypothetical protein GCM10017566_37190 [Amycolatopsis bartoniae]